MSPSTRRPKDPMAAAEAVFKRGGAPVPIEGPAKRPAVPAARETVTLKIDSDVLEKFQSEGPGWQDRINAALRASIAPPQSSGAGKRPEDLNATNDD